MKSRGWTSDDASHKIFPNIRSEDSIRDVLRTVLAGGEKGYFDPDEWNRLMKKYGTMSEHKLRVIAHLRGWHIEGMGERIEGGKRKTTGRSTSSRVLEPTGGKI